MEINNLYSIKSFAFIRPTYGKPKTKYENKYEKK